MAIDVECTNPECGCRMQFDSLPPGGEVTCPACGQKIQLSEAEEVPPPLEDEYKQAEEMAEQTVLDLEPVQVAAPVAQPAPEPSAAAEEADLVGDEEREEDRPIDDWVGEAAKPPDNGFQSSRVKQKRELPPVLIVSVFSCSLLIVLIIAKWYIQTGRWAGEKPKPPAPVAQKQEEETSPSEGWGSDEEIAKRLGKRLEEWEKSRPDPSFVTVSRDGTANFKTLRQALMAVEDGGIVEIQDSHIYDEGNIGNWNSEDPEEKRINRKRNVTIRVANGKRAGVRWPADEDPKNYTNYLLYAGPDWTIRNLVLVGHRSKKVSGIGGYSGGLDVRGCTFVHLRYGIMRGSYHEETEIRDCVFQDVYATVMLSESSEIPYVVFHNNVVKNASYGFTVYRRKDMKDPPDLLAFSVRNSIFVGVGDLLRGQTMPRRMDLRCDYNCFWKAPSAADAAAPPPYGQPSAPNVLAEHLAKLRKAKKCDGHSINADPLLKKNYRLDANSPCRGKGRKGDDMGVNWSRVTTQAGSEHGANGQSASRKGRAKGTKTSGM
ncbi:MAG: hypothetical protein GXP25_24965 [Planctomycetes bacterium]|nr:hypothetical protein [Planctomycetota bacterium]